MADELKSMFRSQANEMTLDELEDKQRYDMEMQKRKEILKKQSINMFSLK
jgi:hypothetical protein